MVCHILCGMGWVGDGPLWRGWWCCLTWGHRHGVSCSTSSHMWHSCHFPRFLLRDGSLTQIYIISFMVPVTPCDSLSTMVKHSTLTGCPEMWLWWCLGVGLLWCSFSLSPKDLPDSPIYSSMQPMWASKLVYYLLFWHLTVLLFRGHE